MAKTSAEPAVSWGDLRGALLDALDGMEDMIIYVPEYFVAKWEHQGFIDRARAVIDASADAAPAPSAPAEYRCTFCRSPVILRQLRWFRRSPRSAQHLAGVTQCQETRVYADPAPNAIEHVAQ